LPKVREADPATLIVANGFSCKTQIEQGGTGRRALHVAQVMKLAREHGPSGPDGGYPERGLSVDRPQPSARRAARVAAAAGVGAAAAAGAGLVLRARD
jgi:hypothetical protein